MPPGTRAGVPPASCNDRRKPASRHQIPRSKPAAMAHRQHECGPGGRQQKGHVPRRPGPPVIQPAEVAVEPQAGKESVRDRIKPGMDRLQQRSAERNHLPRRAVSRILPPEKSRAPGPSLRRAAYRNATNCGRNTSRRRRPPRRNTARRPRDSGAARGPDSPRPGPRR